MPRAGHIPQEPPKNVKDLFEHFFMVAMRFCIYKGISEKYKGKYAIRPFLLSFLVGRSNQLNSFARMLHFYCCFRRHPYRSHFRPYGRNMVIWPYSHMAIWPKMPSIWVSPETAIKMKHSGKGIKLIRPSY